MSGSAQGLKNCSMCGEQKLITDFNCQAKSSDGYQAYCRVCQARHKRLLRYGVTDQWYDQRMAEQENCCGVCGEHIDDYLPRYRGKRVAFDVDHCHTTGKARGLLCNRCNMVLGQVNDDIGLLKHMIRYLRKHKI